MPTNKKYYKRIIVKFSGEMLLGNNCHGIDSEVVEYIANEIKSVVKLGVQVGIVIGGGNFFRGADLQRTNVCRVTGDYLGMLATIFNALTMKDLFERLGLQTKVLSALPIAGFIEGYSQDKACDFLRQKFVVIFAGGTGNPLVTTDTALVLRGVEVGADLILKATKVDGIYSHDPLLDKRAKLYNDLTYQEVLSKELAIMDLAAFSLCRDHQIELRVFNMHKKGALLNIINGKNEGTKVSRKK